MTGSFSGSDSLLSRRRFLQTAGASAVLARSGWARGLAPSDRITIGVIGWGMMGPANTKAFLTMDDCQVVAACELDGKKMQEALATINGHYGNQDCKPYHDYREMIARTDIDAIMIAVPDQWHALIATEAAAHKKDIYGEKPLARTIFEQQAIVRAVQKNGVMWQTGSWQRSLTSFRKAAEIVRNGMIGDVTHIEVGLPGGHHDFPHTLPALMEKLASLPDKPADPSQIVPGTPAWDLAVSEPPADFDYDMWLGP
jgi:predicted dehydrogenase